MAQIYPLLLKPIDTEIFAFPHKVLEVPKTVVSLKRWTGSPIANTFGGKPLVDVNGKPMFAELAIMNIFIASGWQARWIETYGANATGPFHLSDWRDGKLKEQLVDQIKDGKVVQLLREISVNNGNTYSGCWDIVAWQNSQIIFAESKRTKKDKLRQTQYNWLSAGISYGLTVDDFLVVQWDFDLKG